MEDGGVGEVEAAVEEAGVVVGGRAGGLEAVLGVLAPEAAAVQILGGNRFPRK